MGRIIVVGGDSAILLKFLTRPEIRPRLAAVSREVDFAAMPKGWRDRDYLGDFADSIGSLADRDVGSRDAKSNRALELAVSPIR